MEPIKWEPINLLCVGALVKSDSIFVLRNSIQTLKSFNTIGFFTGRNYSKNESVAGTIKGSRPILQRSNFIILTVSSSP